MTWARPRGTDSRLLFTAGLLLAVWIGPYPSESPWLHASHAQPDQDVQLSRDANTRVENLPFAHRPDTLRSSVFFNDRFASNRWEPGDPDPPAPPSSHYAYFSDRYIAGPHESTKLFGLWQYATIATNGVAQGDYDRGHAIFMAHLRSALTSPGVWLAEDGARKSRNCVIQVSLMPWYLSESSNRPIV
ncbi:MAG: hypothetical protein HRU13_13860, partial [Phycisphaerales bacterium]|nr:hypothetical protein [Phycisphaerales bacterium]